MKRILIAASMISCVFLTSCGNAETEDSTATEDNAVAAATTSDLATNDTAKNALETAINQPNAATVVDPAAAVTPAPAVAAKGASGKVNPPHGQPGHVCELPVGAPLDGSAAKAAPQNVQVQQPAQQSQPIQITPSAQPAAAGATVAGTNPPHGQPGHTCDLPVGAPLNK